MTSKSRGGKTTGKVYTVETILNKRERNGRAEYLLKWRGHPESANTWEPEDNLNCPELLDKFNKTLEEMESLQPQGEIQQVIGAVKMNGEIFYMVKYSGNDENAEFLASRVVSNVCPKKVIEFYEKRHDNFC